jgi:hypothetical protein
MFRTNGDTQNGANLDNDSGQLTLKVFRQGHHGASTAVPFHLHIEFIHNIAISIAKII